MSYRCFDFECAKCEHVYECLVQGVEGAPDPCPACGGKKATKLFSSPKLATKTVPVYPGSHYHMAGYGAELRRPAEKAGRQVSMASATRRDRRPRP